MKNEYDVRDIELTGERVFAANNFYRVRVQGMQNCTVLDVVEDVSDEISTSYNSSTAESDSYTD